MTQAPNLQRIVLPVAGMDCGGCVRSVDKAVRALPGVEEHMTFPLPKGLARGEAPAPGVDPAA